MKITELPLRGAYLIELEPHYDERGYFSRVFCEKEFRNQGLSSCYKQANTAFNLQKGQIRGIHFQENPYAETKLVRCTRGSLFDVAVDLRKDSPTYQQWYGDTLTESNGKMLYIPKGFGHAYQTLEGNTDIFYMVDEFFTPTAYRALDPHQFLIQWPLTTSYQHK